MKLFLIGGFLGSGKTTAIVQAAKALLNDNSAVGVVTNDQGTQLVDTAIIQDSGIAVEEVTGSCFCCNYNELDKCIQSLSLTKRPDVIFAESVGSCTDLVATIVKPMKKFRKEIEIVVSVFADARILPTLVQGSRLFADSVNYIYKKQLEEADLIVLSKIDLLDAQQIENLKQVVRTFYPYKEIYYQNSFDEQHIRNWLTGAMTFNSGTVRKSLEIDYDKYGEGEAELAWLDQEITLTSIHKNTSFATALLINTIYEKINEHALPIGHLKFLVSDEYGHVKVSFTNNMERKFNGFDSVPETNKKNILINARIQTSPGHLRALISTVIKDIEQQTGCTALNKKLAAFLPGYPKPTHRMLNEQT